MSSQHNKGMVFNIQRFSTGDGPGIRTTVFLKGCNLNCLWCHNPESIDGKQILRLIRRKCTVCGRCADVCRFGAVGIDAGKRIYIPEKCNLCGECVSACPEKALDITGEYYDIDTLYAVILKDIDFYAESGGGVTFSGGEPLLQAKFLSRLLKRLRESGIHSAIDTALNVGRSYIEEVLPWTDLMLVDLKGMDTAAHRRNTGAGNELILANAQWLSRQDVDMIIRMPLVKGLNDSEAEIRAAAGFINNWPRLIGVELLSYHSLGVEKTGEYEILGMQREYSPPDEQSLTVAREIIKSAGIRLL